MDRYRREKVTEPEGVFAEIFRLAQPYLQDRENDLHTRISYDFASRLLYEEPGDPNVALSAILLHDVGYSQMTEEQIGKAFGPHLVDKTWQIMHEVEGAKLARKILQGMQQPEDRIEHVCLIIEGHDTRLDAVSPEDALVKDADKLYRYTRSGHRFVVDALQMGNGQYLQILEASVEKWFFTPTAKKIAAEQLRVLTDKSQADSQ